MGKRHLEAAKARKDDEFYTLRADVEREVKNFSEKFQEKVVICPCNDGESSAFTEFFSENFRELGLAGAFFVEFSEKGQGRVSRDGKNWENLKGNGSFQSAEVLELLHSSDIVCTNPPFSLLRPFCEVLLASQKDFLICAPELSVAAREIAPAFVDGRINFGYTSPKIFGKPDGSTAQLGNVSWLTTFEVEKSPQILAKTSVWDFLLYDNFGAHEIPRVSQIPENCGKELLGVPVSFAKKLDRRQFEVVGVSGNGDVPSLFVEGAEKFRRLILRKKEQV